MYKIIDRDGVCSCLTSATYRTDVIVGWRARARAKIKDPPDRGIPERERQRKTKENSKRIPSNARIGLCFLLSSVSSLPGVSAFAEIGSLASRFISAGILRVSRLIFLSTIPFTSRNCPRGQPRVGERAIIGIITTSGDVKRICREHCRGSCNSSPLRQRAIMRALIKGQISEAGRRNLKASDDRTIFVLSRRCRVLGFVS